MKVLITGAKGFLGKHVVARLIRAGHETICFKGDIGDADLELPLDVDAIVHLAAVVGNKNRRLFKRVNVMGTRYIIERAKADGVKKIIFISSLRVLSKEKNLYIESKRQGEKIVVNSSLPYIILRPSLLYGPGDKKNIVFLAGLAKKMRLAPVFKFRMQPIFVDDMAEMIYQSFDLVPDKIINIAGSQIISHVDFLLALKGLGYKFAILNWPRFFSGLLKLISFLPFLLISRQQIKTLLADEIYPEYGWQKIFKITEKPFKEGLAETLKT